MGEAANIFSIVIDMVFNATQHVCIDVKILEWIVLARLTILVCLSMLPETMRLT